MSPHRSAVTVSLYDVPMDDVEMAPCDGAVAEGAVDVLIADDEPVVANTLAMILRAAGLRTRVAYDGHTALQLGEKVRPRVLVSDVAMPGMTGVELALQLLRSVPECKVLLFSGHAMHSDLAPAVEAGYDFPLLAKPVHPNEMIRSVRRFLETDANRLPAVPALTMPAEQAA